MAWNQKQRDDLIVGNANEVRNFSELGQLSSRLEAARVLLIDSCQTLTDGEAVERGAKRERETAGSVYDQCTIAIA